MKKQILPGAPIMPLLLLVLISTALAGDPVMVDPPVKTTVLKSDSSRVNGQVISYGNASFELVNDKKEHVTINWGELEAKNVFALYGRLIEKKGAANWADLGELLQELPDGKQWAERAFARALRMDPKLKARIAADHAAATRPATQETGEKTGPVEGAGNGGENGGPQVEGATEQNWWGKISDDNQAASVKELKVFADETRAKIDPNLVLLETKYFLFYSDLDPREAQNWASLLDRMYARMSEIFAVPKDTNIWRGKALVFVFRESGDYYRFQQVMHHTDASGSAGMCHSFGNGYVHIAFYRQRDELTFAHVLVHESTHGFLHRYRSPEPIKSWIIEGLAETIASELVPQTGHSIRVRSEAQSGVRMFNGVGNLFDAEHISGWQYPVAQSMCEFMIRQSKQRYVDFINGIKDGLSWEKSLETKYGVEPTRLSDALIVDLNVRLNPNR